MSHRRRDAHIAHFYAEVEDGEDRRGNTQTKFNPPNGKVASAQVRITDAGGSYTQTMAGEVETDETYLTGPSWVFDEINAGQRCAIEGDSYDFRSDAPDEGDWYSVESVDRLLRRGRSIDGVEITLTDVS